MGMIRISLLLVLIITALSLAQECPQSRNYTVTTQAEIDSVTSDCTRIAGELALVDWSGPFTLPNITHVESIALYSGSITTFELPHLEYYSGNLVLTNVPSLRKVSLPRLEYIDVLHIGLVGDTPELHCPMLRNASSVFLRGNFASQSFPSLQNIATKFDICNSINCDNYSYMNASTSMDLSFPDLERVANFKVAGNMSKLSTPSVTAVTCADCHWAALHLKLFGSSPIAVDFPKLSEVEGNVYIRGDIASISLPVAHQYPDEFTIIPHQPLNISLPVQRGLNFLFSGNVSSIQLPDLRDFSRIHINSDISIDCDRLFEELKETSSTPLNETDIYDYFQCSRGSYTFGIDAWVTAAIGLAVSIAVGL
ncbi:uncharacterized protein BJX67DRAFT_352380 [Aspergillus lucknowensis]|uniref:Uncharacterized protein n=1 Tax=Aspergillus lucknowensis TaxID=176173 RepID=A0ABR4LTY8_9EURO